MTVEGSDRLPHIGLNAHLLCGQQGYRRAGIHTYIAQQINHLPMIGSDLQFSVFTNFQDELDSRLSSNTISTRWPTGNRLVRIAWEQLSWPLAAQKRRLDLLHGMAFVTPVLSPCPTVVTVYDLSFIYFPDRYPPLQRIYLTSQTRRSCRQARRVVTISESGRQDVHKLFDVPLERIAVINPGVDPNFYPRSQNEIEAFRSRQELPQEYVLHVGTLQPRKSIPTLIMAFASLNRPELQLILIGGKGWAYEEIFSLVRELNLEERVRFTGYVSDGELPLWYNAAAVLVFPSVYEGFGLPIAEAMASGTPVVAANTSSIPEATGSAARLFKVQDGAELSDHIAAVLDDPHLAATMRENGLQQSRRFSWERAGEDMVDVYRQALEEA
jgi:glycosyltransferase involved in cell wall biosynthesis